jgi:hypothetical protein
MLKRRKLLLSIVAVVAVPLVGLGIYWAMQPKARAEVSLDNFRQLSAGMTLEQVEEVLGPVTTRETDWDRRTVTCRWSGEAGDVLLMFPLDTQGSFTRGLFSDANDIHIERANESEWDKVRRWVRRRTGW